MPVAGNDTLVEAKITDARSTCSNEPQIMNNATTITTANFRIDLTKQLKPPAYDPEDGTVIYLPEYGVVDPS